MESQLARLSPDVASLIQATATPQSLMIAASRRPARRSGAVKRHCNYFVIEYTLRYKVSDKAGVADLDRASADILAICGQAVIFFQDNFAMKSTFHCRTYIGMTIGRQPVAWTCGGRLDERESYREAGSDGKRRSSLNDHLQFADAGRS
jgi:hypothetical protein